MFATLIDIIKKIGYGIAIAVCFIFEMLANLIIAPIWIIHDWIAHKRAVYLGKKYLEKYHKDE